LNAIDQRMQGELEGALAEARQQGVGALVLTGAGRGFCSGADVSQMRSAQEPGCGPAMEPLDRLRRPTGWLTLLLHSFEKPLIAAVNGVAAGAGLSLALACDIRIAAESARFSAIFVKRALMPDYGCTWLLPRAVGLSRALEMMYSARMVDARQAERIGLVSRVVPDGHLLAEAKALAGEIAQGPPIALELTRRATYRGLGLSLEESIAQEVYGNSICAATEDHREGVRAFLEKREPVFKGR
ncbi:MAG: enoyl-CoA hydratase/isomerase family protein, partial [Chloroflexi bacterium]|nr:enoyl-CoA hydratase/isomerase family protein [Chloroflexota bacterium]